MITIDRATSSSGISLSDINELLSQLHLNRDYHLSATQADLDSIASDKRVILLLVRDESKVIGMATANVVAKFGRTIGYIEDVIVSETYRGQGIGTKLMKRAIEEAKHAGVRYLYLTSRDGRTAANSLYQKLGFEKRETNNYRLKM